MPEKPFEPGLCHTARAGRVIDCPDGARFPYYPSIQELYAFDFVFPNSERQAVVTFLIRFASNFLLFGRCFINCAAIIYNLFDKAQVDQLGESSTFREITIAGAGVLEASWMMLTVITIAILVLKIFIVGEEQKAGRRLSHGTSRVNPDTSSGQDHMYLHGRASISECDYACTVLHARTLADNLKNMANLNLLQLVNTFNARKLNQTYSVMKEKMYGRSFFLALLTALGNAAWLLWVFVVLLVAVYAKLQPMSDLIKMKPLDWSWSETLIFLSFVNNIKSISDTEKAVLELLQYVCCGHFVPYSGQQVEEAEKLVMQWLLDNITWCKHKGAHSSKCKEGCQLTKSGLISFFVNLDTTSLCRYLEMTEGCGITALHSRHQLHKLFHQKAAAGHKDNITKADEYLIQADPKMVNVMHSESVRSLEYLLEDGHCWTSLDSFLYCGLLPEVSYKAGSGNRKSRKKEMVEYFKPYLPSNIRESNEFSTLRKPRPKDTIARLNHWQDTFHKIDAQDGLIDGMMEMHFLQEALEADDTVTAEERKWVLEKADADENGKIDFDEFMYSYAKEVNGGIWSDFPQEGVTLVIKAAPHLHKHLQKDQSWLEIKKGNILPPKVQVRLVFIRRSHSKDCVDPSEERREYQTSYHQVLRDPEWNEFVFLPAERLEDWRNRMRCQHNNCAVCAQQGESFRVELSVQISNFMGGVTKMVTDWLTDCLAG